VRALSVSLFLALWVHFAHISIRVPDATTIIDFPQTPNPAGLTKVIFIGALLTDRRVPYTPLDQASLPKVPRKPKV